ncbi:MAG: flavin reductase family protein [Tannerella sp.]|jgi:flavin reductase (DIM6/NTAB) family NADH-FMN oxidoreductase RutF|nr:flavin reductase family protein [Tannerella sp.]
MKQNWKPGTLVYPLPAVMISCGDEESGPNIITASWVGTLCSNPPICYASIRPERYSHDIILRTGEFVINLTTEKLALATDWCGVKSGRDVDKFKAMGLIPGKATVVKAPTIEEAPLSIECRVREVKPLGSHDMFIADVVNILADEAYMDKDGAFDMQRAGLIAYCHGKYYGLGKFLGKFGWTVKKS